MKEIKRHIICEKDVGLFSLIQQVISHVPFALSYGAHPIVLWGNRCCYWTKSGYKNKHNVWEYYFEPLIKKEKANSLTHNLTEHIANNPPSFKSKGYFLNNYTFVSNNFGNHKAFNGLAIKIPFKWEDPDSIIRNMASEIIQRYIRPRTYITDKVNDFYALNMQNKLIIGVHIRGTDVSDLKTEFNLYRRYSYQPKNYIKAIRKALTSKPNAKIFVATDSIKALNLIKDHFPNKIIHYSSIFQISNQVTGIGAMGWKMPEYLTQDSQKAAKNGEEAIIDYLLLSQCQHLIHNGSSLARTVLLKEPLLSNENLHSKKKYLRRVFDPTSLEIFYLSKILIQKSLWRLSNFLKMINKLLH